MKINIKKLDDNAVIPSYGSEFAAGLDITATSVTENELYIEYGTSLAIELPTGHAALLYPRSSISKYHLTLANSVGIVDEDYRGEVKFRFKKTSNTAYQNIYKIGDKIGQLVVMPVPRIEFVETAELLESKRGSGGFGSTDAK